MRSLHLKRTIVLASAISAASSTNATIDLAGLPGDFPHQEELCSLDQNREALRAESAEQALLTPIIDSIKVDGELVWNRMGTQLPVFKPGDIVTLSGSNFGQGVDIDFSKIMLGNTRILETDLRMFDQKLAVSDQVNYETDEQVDAWEKML